MKILEKRDPNVVCYCPHCSSKLLLEKSDIHWYTDISGTRSPYVTCFNCEKDFDVEGLNGIHKLY